MGSRAEGPCGLVVRLGRRARSSGGLLGAAPRERLVEAGRLFRPHFLHPEIGQCPACWEAAGQGAPPRGRAPDAWFILWSLHIRGTDCLAGVRPCSHGLGSHGVWGWAALGDAVMSGKAFFRMRPPWLRFPVAAARAWLFLVWIQAVRKGGGWGSAARMPGVPGSRGGWVGPTRVLWGGRTPAGTGCQDLWMQPCARRMLGAHGHPASASQGPRWGSAVTRDETSALGGRGPSVNLRLF